MKKTAILYILAGALLASGCATTPRVQTEFDEKTDFTAYQKFAMAPMPTRVVGANPGAILRVGPVLKETAARAVAGLGYAEVSEPKQADFVIRVHGRLVPKSEVTDWGFAPIQTRYGWYRRYPYSLYGTNNVTVDNYKEGTLVVEAYDVRSKELVWVGWVTGRAAENEAQALEAATEAVREILAGFPAKGTSVTPRP